MKSTLAPSTNVEDARRDRVPKGDSKNPFSRAADRNAVNTSGGGGYNGPSNVTPPDPNPFQGMIDAMQQMGDTAHENLRQIIRKEIGQLNRTDENGYNIRSRAKTGALRPNTRSTDGTSN